MSGLEKHVNPYSGEGDVGQWLKKLKLVAKVRKLEDLASLVPLLLEGAAFMVYDHMRAEDQYNIEKIEAALLNAFSMDPFQAYDLFTSRVWENESPDVFLADLQRLAGLAGVNEDILIKRAFIVGLPHQVSSQLRASARILELDISEVVRQARALMTDLVTPVGLAAISPFRKATQAADRQCYGCGKSGHLRNKCPSRSTISCWTCGETGHTSKACPKRFQGNDRGEIGAPPVSL